MKKQKEALQVMQTEVMSNHYKKGGEKNLIAHCWKPLQVKITRKMQSSYSDHCDNCQSSNRESSTSVMPEQVASNQTMAAELCSILKSEADIIKYH